MITPENYARCYLLCRDRIKAVPGHQNDEVIVGAVGPWNPDSGDWLVYYKEILKRVIGRCDAIAIHAYTHGTDPALVFSDEKTGPPTAYYHFRVYRDCMAAIPKELRHLPVYITEADQDDPWLNKNTGWVRNAYQEINAWNSDPKNQPIYCLVLYRWSEDDPNARWNISKKGDVIKDFKEAMQNEYRTPVRPGPITPAARPNYGVVYPASLPPLMATVSTPFAVPIRLKNNGALTWKAGDANWEASQAQVMHLAYHWLDETGQVIVRDGKRTLLPNDVPPDGEVELIAQVVPPDSPGTYTLEWDMVHEFITWFADQQVKTARQTVTVLPKVVRPEYGVAYPEVLPALTATVGVPFTVNLHLKNSGALTWQAGGLNWEAVRATVVHLAYHWLDDAGRMIARDGKRTLLPNDVPPDGEVDVVAQVEPPDKAGNYTLEWDMVHEFVTWFADKQVKTARQAVTVQPAPVKPPAWLATANPNPADALLVLDRRNDTAWTAPADGETGRWLVIDLLEPKLVSEVETAGPVDATPAKVRVSLSEDGINWVEVARVRAAAGDIRASFAAQPARYVRLEELLPAWSVIEANVTAVDFAKMTARASVRSEEAYKALDGQPDTAWSSGDPQKPGLWFEVDLGSVQRLQRLVLSSPKNNVPRGYTIAISTDGQNWREVARKENNFSQLDESFAMPPARYVRIEQIASPQYPRPWMISELRADTASNWSATASVNPADARLAIDGDPTTAWSSNQPQAAGMQFSLDLGEVLVVRRVVATSPEKEFPRGINISVSEDGQNWTLVKQIPRWFRAPLDAEFDPVRARYLLLEQTYPLPPAWGVKWTINEIGVYGTTPVSRGGRSRRRGR